MVHSFLVHFPIAAWVMGNVAMLADYVWHRGELRWQAQSWMCLYTAAVMSIPAALSGQAMLTELDPVVLAISQTHQTLGNMVPWFMGGIGALRLHTLFGGKPLIESNWAWASIVSAVSVLILLTGHLGGIIRHG